MDVDRLLESMPKALGDAGFTTAAFFGSVATGTYDEYSDVDLIVCSEGVPPEDFLANLAAEFGTPLFRPFSLTSEGKLSKLSGRYWFAPLSPFCKIDVSFHEASAFAQLIRKGSAYVSGPFKTIPCSTNTGNKIHAVGFEKIDLPPDIDLYKWLRLAKTYHRGGDITTDERGQLIDLTRKATHYLNAIGFKALANSVSKSSCASKAPEGICEQGDQQADNRISCCWR